MAGRPKKTQISSQEGQNRGEVSSDKLLNANQGSNTTPANLDLEILKELRLLNQYLALFHMYGNRATLYNLDGSKKE